MRKLITRIIRRKPKAKTDAAHLLMQIDGLTRDIHRTAYRARCIRQKLGLDTVKDSEA